MLKRISNALKAKFSNFTMCKTSRKNTCIHGYYFDTKNKPDVIGCYNGNVANSDCCYEKQYICEHYGTDSVVLVKRITIYTLVMGVFAFVLIRWLFL